MKNGNWKEFTHKARINMNIHCNKKVRSRFTLLKSRKTRKYFYPHRKKKLKEKMLI